MSRINEYFPRNDNAFPQQSVANVPPALFRQERDWSCSVACLRTILAAAGASCTEEQLIGQLSMTPGPHYSKDLKKLGLPEGVEAIWGCDEPDITVRKLFDYMASGYYIMAETLYNYAHWYVLLGYY
ncbi:MAG: hypothetical protein IJH77_06185, partial [Mogibacterium sp.]|nr:hypothetical protein [Mogibacterium sp.]